MVILLLHEFRWVLLVYVIEDLHAVGTSCTVNRVVFGVRSGYIIYFIFNCYYPIDSHIRVCLTL